MSYLEAMEDGIPKIRGCYEITCSVCGTEKIRSRSYSRQKKYTCHDCKCIRDGIKNEDTAMRKEIKFAKAIDNIEATVGDLEPYRDAIEKVKKSLHHTSWFRSTEEIMVAIELLKNGVKAIHQQKIGKYKVDFVLPDYKVLLEIDGKPFHNSDTRAAEGMRDGSIILTMGLDWEMVRIDTGRINKDITKLLPSIQTILDNRKLARSMHY